MFLARRRDIETYRLDDEALLYDPSNGKIHHLNETASSVWESCNGLSSVGGIARAQARHYGIEFDEALDDVEQLITMFAEAELLAVSEKS